MIKANGIDWYREDMNGGGPLPAWRNHDAADRQGITENFYVQAHLAYWDVLLAMNPGLRIDSCASGGRRNDLESMRRAVPLWRSDVVQVVDQASLGDLNQGLTYGLSAWLPFQGTSCQGVWDPYSFRSSYVTAFDNGGINPANKAAQQQAYAEWRALAPIMLNGDYYPLMPYSLTNDVWIAWQFNQPETAEGFVQAFRRRNSGEAVRTFRLYDLDPRAKYQVKNFDEKASAQISGKELMEQGLRIEIPSKPGAAVTIYKRI
jgi:alpha-galactosidase